MKSYMKSLKVTLLLSACALSPTAAAAAPAPAVAPAPLDVSPRYPHAHLVVGARDEYTPVTRFALQGVRFELPAQVALSALAFDPVPLGDSVPVGTPVRYAPGAAYDLQARVGANIDTRKALSPLFFQAHYEQDITSGVLAGGEASARGVGLPLSEPRADLTLRQAYGAVSFASVLTLQGGYMTSHWGLGLLANDGAHGWAPGSAYFGDPRGGDRVLRAMAATGPHRVLGRPLLASVGVDRVQGDDIMLPGDRAEQALAAVVWGFQQQRQVGAYVVRRHQDIPASSSQPRDKRTDVWVGDIYARWYWPLAERLKLELEAEGVWIQGDTTLAPSPEHRVNEVVQAALAARLKLTSPRGGGVVDFVAASGDQNFDDGRQNAFRADPNFEMGLLLFRHVLSAQSARAPITAADPDLVGSPNEDLDRFPTRRSVSNTYAVFPRGWFRLARGVEVYGGPLLAWGEVPVADPRNSRFNGGYPANLLGSRAGERFLGVEADVGVRGTLVVGGAELMLGAEGGALLPGAGLQGEGGVGAEALYGARLLARLRL
ncbi:MAG: hypothetical protein FJ138_06355 [Deltaproteobacteria bacterium]|nr:hypothetical protein [Deltaproteobacteria bacterium]